MSNEIFKFYLYVKQTKIINTIVYICILLILFLPNQAISASLTRQAVLESTFDIVDTFDELQDWTPNKTGDVTDLSSMPKKMNGSPSIWNYYSNYGNTLNPVNSWIGDHSFMGSSDYVFGEKGKSLCLSYGLPVYDCGPARLGIYFGDGSPKSGYKKIFVFFMLKFAPEFFRKSDPTTFEWVGSVKFTQISSGFRDPFNWGTLSEQAMAQNNAQNRNVYGLNGTLWYLSNGGECSLNNMCFADDVTVARKMLTTIECPGSLECYQYVKTADVRQWPNTTFGKSILANEWIGIEFSVDIGTTGNPDGNAEVWTYDKSGNILGHQILINENKMQIFDHLYNKVVLGGNRWGYNVLWDPSSDLGDSYDNRMFIDDFIINGSRIGPTYFNFLKNELYSPTGGKGGLEKN